MSANSLLFWMSARREGTWSQFRAVVEELHLPESELLAETGEAESGGVRRGLPLYRELRWNLQRLGHAEFFSGAEDGGWRVAPPCLAVSYHPDGWLGIVSGARSRTLLGRLAKAYGYGFENAGSEGCPDILRIRANSKDVLESVASDSRMAIQMDAPAMILMSLPAVDDRVVKKAAQLPLGRDWKIDRFSVDDLAWHAASRQEAETAKGGLFRFLLHHRRHNYYCAGGSAFEMHGPVGKYLALRRARRRIFRYSAGDSCLSVPAICRPPFLVERALILCSGFPPSLERGARNRLCLNYRNIPSNIAGLALALLRQG